MFSSAVPLSRPYCGNAIQNMTWYLLQVTPMVCIKSVRDEHTSIWFVPIAHILQNIRGKLRPLKPSWLKKAFPITRLWGWRKKEDAIRGSPTTKFMWEKFLLTKPLKFTNFSETLLPAGLSMMRASPYLWWFQGENCISIYLLWRKCDVYSNFRYN